MVGGLKLTGTRHMDRASHSQGSAVSSQKRSTRKAGRKEKREHERKLTGIAQEGNAEDHKAKKESWCVN